MVEIATQTPPSSEKQGDSLDQKPEESPSKEEPDTDKIKEGIRTASGKLRSWKKIQ